MARHGDTADPVQVQTVGGGGGGDASAANQVIQTARLDSILAKIIAAPATEAKQDTGNTSLATIAGKDFATQTTLAAILAKLIAGPATEATLASVLTSVDGLETLGAAHSTKLDTLHTDLVATNGFVDGIETLIGSTNTKLDTLHTDIGTTLHADVDGLETLITATNAALAHQKSGVVWDGAVELPVKRAVINASASGNNTLVAAVASKKIRVVSLFLQSAGTVTGTFQDGAAGTPITGGLPESLSTGLVLPFNPHGWFETSAATLLNLSLGAAIAVGGALQYVEGT